MRKRNRIYDQNKIDNFFNSLKIASSLLIATVLIVVIVLIVSDQPAQALSSFFVGPVDSVRHLANIVENMMPLLFTGVATCLMFAGGDVVLAGEGAFFFGAFLSAAVVTTTPFSGPVKLLVSILISMLGGALVASVSIVAKNRFNAQPFVFSLLFNYVVMYGCNFCLNYFLRDPDYIGIATYSFPADAKFAEVIPKTSVTWGIFLAIAAVIFGWFIMYKTKLGYKASLVKDNPLYAVNMGVNASRVSLYMALLGGAIAGLGGCAEMLSKFTRYYWTTQPGYGWDGFLLVTLAGNNPAFIPFAALFLGYIRTGASVMNVFADVPMELISAIQAVMVLLVASKALFGKAQQRVTRRNSELKRAQEKEHAALDDKKIKQEQKG